MLGLVTQTTEQTMKRALKIIGRFALGGWVFVTGTLAAIDLILVAAQRVFILENLFWVLLYGLVGLTGGAGVGVIAAVLDSLIKLPVTKTTATSGMADPTVWPPPLQSPDECGALALLRLGD